MFSAFVCSSLFQSQVIYLHYSFSFPNPQMLTWYECVWNTSAHTRTLLLRYCTVCRLYSYIRSLPLRGPFCGWCNNASVRWEQIHLLLYELPAWVLSKKADLSSFSFFATLMCPKGGKCDLCWRITLISVKILCHPGHGCPWRIEPRTTGCCIYLKMFHHLFKRLLQLWLRKQPQVSTPKSSCLQFKSSWI